jgi:hypothetical protein
MSNVPFSPEDMARRRKRSIVMALAIAALMIVFFAASIVKIADSAKFAVGG